ncbi:MAG: RNA polymerase sigma factor [Chitinophagaceae bacterium]
MYEYLHGFAASICYRYVSNPLDVDGLINESFLKLFKNIHLFKVADTANTDVALKGWFKRIIINTCIDFLRKQKSLGNTTEITQNEQDFLIDEDETGLDKLQYKEIIEAIKQLSPVYRTVFNLFVIEGLTHEEIATELNISVGASKSNLSKARTNLRKILLAQSTEMKYA